MLSTTDQSPTGLEISGATTLMLGELPGATSGVLAGCHCHSDDEVTSSSLGVCKTLSSLA